MDLDQLISLLIELETQLRQLKSEGVTLNKREITQIDKSFQGDVAEMRKRNKPSVFSKIVNGINKFLQGPGGELVKMIPSIVSAL